MADVDEDPYAVSSDSDENSERLKKPPPKITIEGRSNTDFKQLKESLISEKKERVRDEKTLEEIAELKRTKAEQLSRFKKEFEEGTIKNDDPGSSNGGGGSAAMPSVERPTGLDKQTLSAFKEKFEKMDVTLDLNLEERLKSIEKSLEGVGKENLATMKDMFEKQPNKEFTKEQLDELVALQRSDADKRRLLDAFNHREEEPKDCVICGKIVYPVERVVASKRLYHTGCFNCSVCGKKLSPNTFNSHKGDLYCKPHMLEVLHPERAGTTGGGTGTVDEDDGEQIQEDDDEEFAVSSKPKQLGADVVRAGNANIGDELSQLRSSLKDKKETWQQSVQQAATNQSERSSVALAEEIGAGRVKANLNRFISGTAGDDVDGCEADEANEEKRKQLDAIREQVSEVKNKWKTGDVEKAEVHDAAARDELEELKKGPKVRERFSERLEHAEALADGEKVVRSYDRSELDTSNAAEARKSFLEGHAFQSAPVEKSATDLQDLKFEGLKSFKDRFEKGEGGDVTTSRDKSILDLNVQLKNIKQALQEGGNPADMTPEARAERKKQEIEAEFLRYKLSRKIQAKRQAQQAAAAGGGGDANAELDEVEAEAAFPVEVGSIKNRFEAGEAFKSGDVHGNKDLDVDIKMAGKAREKFRNIEAQGGAGAPIPKTKADSKPSKWDKKAESTAEVVNKRTVVESSSSDEEDNFDVKNLMNKFKNIENIAPNKMERRLDELEALRVEAKNLRKRFETADDADEDVQSEERKRQLEEEFRRLKEERERAQKELEAERATAAAEENDAAAHKEEVQVAAAHASKMTEKWEKIHKKEAKKAQKSQMGGGGK